MKSCSRCLIEFQDDCFNKSSKTKDGLRSWCKECESDYQKSRKSDPAYMEYKRNAMKKYYAKHKEAVLERNRQYAAKNGTKIYEKAKQRVKLWHEENYKNIGWLLRFRKKTSSKALFVLSPDIQRQKMIKFRKNNPNYYKNWIKKYAEKYPDTLKAARCLQNNKRREALMAVGDVGLTKGEWLTIMKENGWKCEHCESSKLLAVDHFFPLSKGFPLSVANYTVLCKSCNSAKNNKMPTDFRFSKELLDYKRLQFFRNGALDYVKRLGVEQSSEYLKFIYS